MQHDRVYLSTGSMYDACRRLAPAALGPGWLPWMKTSLIDADHRRTGDATPAALACKVCRGEKTSENARFVRRVLDGRALKAESYQGVFGELLREQHPTLTVEVPYAARSLTAVSAVICGERRVSAAHGWPVVAYETGRASCCSRRPTRSLALPTLPCCPQPQLYFLKAPFAGVRSRPAAFFLHGRARWPTPSTPARARLGSERRPLRARLQVAFGGCRVTFHPPTRGARPSEASMGRGAAAPPAACGGPAAGGTARLPQCARAG